jgi:hypothetical protein
MQEFVSGLPGPSASRPSLQESLKSLGAAVKGYGSPSTSESRALTARITADREGPFDGWLPVLSADELLTASLERVELVDTTKAVQLPLPFAA